MVSQYQYLLPDTAVTRPQFLDVLDPAMTDIQIRTAIANNAVNGGESIYRGDPAREYYKTLARNSLRQDPNTLRDPYEALAPVEIQYLKQVFGVDTSNAVELWKALGGRVQEVAQAVQAGVPPAQAVQAAIADNQSGDAGQDMYEREPLTTAQRGGVGTFDRYSDVPVGGSPVTRDQSDRLGMFEGVQRGNYGGPLSDNPERMADYLNDLFENTELGPGMINYGGLPEDQRVPEALDKNMNGIMETPFGDYTKSGVAGGALGGVVGGLMGMPALGMAGALAGNTYDKAQRWSNPNELRSLNPGMAPAPAPATSIAPATPTMGPGFSTGALPTTPGFSAPAPAPAAPSNTGGSFNGNMGVGFGSQFGNNYGGGFDTGGGGNDGGFNSSPSGSSSFGGGPSASSGVSGSISEGLGNNWGGGFDTGGNSGGSSNSGGGCWIYSTLHNMEKVHMKYYLYIIRYHTEIQSDFSYRGYEAWSKPVSKLFKNNQWLANWFASMAPDYARAKAVRVGILKKRTWRMWYLEKAWDALNYTSGAICYGLSYFKNGTQEANVSKA